MRRSLAADDLIILPQKRFFVKHFFEKLLKFFELKSFSSFSVLTGTFERSLVLFKGFLLRLQKSFFCLSAWRSSIIPHTGVLVNTFWHLFSNFFARGGIGSKTPTEMNPLRHRCAMPAPPRGELYWRWSEDAQKLPLSGELARQRLRGFSLILLHYIGRANPNRV